MTERMLHDLLIETAEHVPAPDLAASTWARARRTRRRRRTGAVALVAAAAAVIAVGVRTVDDDAATRQDPAGTGAPDAPDAVQTTPPGQSTDPTDTEPEGIDPAVVQRAWTPERWDSLPWADTALPRSLDPTTGPVVGTPAATAVAVVQLPTGQGSTLYVLGADGAWRELDGVDVGPVEDAGGYTGPSLAVTALSPDGTRLAVPQPGELLVIDLTDLTVNTFDVPGLPTAAAVWTPDDEVLLGTETRPDGVLVDLTDGSTTSVPYHQDHTVFAADGTAVEAWSRATDLPPYELRRYPPDGSVPQAQPLVVDPAQWPGAVATIGGEGVVVIATEVDSWSIPRGPEEWPGVVVLDAETAEPLAMLPWRLDSPMNRMTPLGMLDDNTVLVRFADKVVAWDYASGDLSRVGELPESQVLSIGLAG